MKSFLSQVGSNGGSDLFSTQPDDSLHCETKDIELMHRVVCQVTLQPLLVHGWAVVKVRRNAEERRSWAPKNCVPKPHTAVNGTSRLRGAPSAYSRAPIFFRVPGPQIYTLTTVAEDMCTITYNRTTEINRAFYSRSHKINMELYIINSLHFASCYKLTATIEISNQ